MTQSRTVSAREAARRLGFKSTNSVLTAIRDGELPAIRSEARVRNGRNNATYRIDTADLVRWAEKRGLESASEPVEASSAPVAPVAPVETESAVTEPVQLWPGTVAGVPIERLESNVARLLVPGAWSHGQRPLAVAADRLELLSKLVLACQYDAARLVVETWGSISPQNP